jgi:hypothetical protein
VEDGSTRRLVEDFYDALARRQPVGEALRTAKLAAMARGMPPSQWAAFTVVGDPTVRVPLRRPPDGRAWYLTAGAAALLLGGALLYWARTRKERGSERG